MLGHIADLEVGLFSSSPFVRKNTKTTLRKMKEHYKRVFATTRYDTMTDTQLSERKIEITEALHRNAQNPDNLTSIREILTLTENELEKRSLAK